MAGANDDDDTSDGEQATIKFSFPDPKSVKKITPRCHPVVPPEYHQGEFYIKSSDDVLKMVKEEKVIRIENRAKVKAVKEDKTLGIMTDEDAFGWKKKKVPGIK